MGFWDFFNYEIARGIVQNRRRNRCRRNSNNGWFYIMLIACVILGILEVVWS